ncbi:hypothetical protein STRIP9103_03593 [Streptomyces ipomoeae 91-03]|uniref:Uncharacterized protein n=1 Tax=Streptomyces ipomoeae 91-03 TaxID=698759 RepID=L1KUR6_9ACTN|nr:hypothetical protein STRIP9103_03593 [Streptomyces ipomoeae 91-03]
MARAFVGAVRRPPKAQGRPGSFRGAGLYRFAAPPRGRDQPPLTRTRRTTPTPELPGTQRPRFRTPH